MKLRIMKHNSQFQSSLSGVCSVLLMLGAGQAGLAQQSTPGKPAAPATAASPAKPPATRSAAEEQETAAPGKPGSEGIKVHGHWILQLRNADGSLGERREFDNSLADGGSFLTGLLAGYFVPGDYAILLAGSACPECFIVNSTWPGNNTFSQGYPTSTTLSLTYNIPLFFGSNGTSMVLAGYIPAPNSGSFSQVAVVYSACLTNPNKGTPATISPESCMTGSSQGLTSYLTSTTLTNAAGVPTPLAVTAGQTIMVTVTISFS